MCNDSKKEILVNGIIDINLIPNNILNPFLEIIKTQIYNYYNDTKNKTPP